MLFRSTVSGFRFDPRTLRDVTPRQRSIYRGAICLILGRGTGARDFHTQAVITRKLLEAEGIDDHHIFPAAYLESRGVNSVRERDCVLNRTLIDRTTNQVIGDRAPSEYLGTIRRTKGFPLDDVLASHSLPTGDDSPLFRNDYEGFRDWRQDQLWQEIRFLTGATRAYDLEAGAEEVA